MKKEILQERILKKEKAIEKLEKKIEKINSISSKELVEACRTNNKELYKKHQFEVEENNKYYSGYDLWQAYRDLEEAKGTLIKYQNQLEVEIQKENSLNELPELFQNLQKMLINSWDEFDKSRRDKMKKEYEELSKLEYPERKEKHRFLDKLYGYNWEDKAYETDESIHDKNVNSAKDIILDLIDRVSSKTGKITSYENLNLASNNAGFLVLNGYVIGEKGTAKVESIMAGGYNIQRLHIRVLVK